MTRFTEKCPNCGSSEYTCTISLEYCPECGLRCDYHNGDGANDVYEMMMDRQAREREEYQEKWAEEHGYN